MLVGSVLDPYLFPKTVIPTRAGIGSVLLCSILSALSMPGHMLCNKLGWKPKSRARGRAKWVAMLRGGLHREARSGQALYLLLLEITFSSKPRTESGGQNRRESCLFLLLRGLEVTVHGWDGGSRGSPGIQVPYFQLYYSWLMAYSLKVTLQSQRLAGISTITVKFQAVFQKWDATGTPVFFLGSACLHTLTQRNAWEGVCKIV